MASNGALVKESAPDPQGTCRRKGSRARPYRTWGHCFAPRRSAIDEFDSTTYRPAQDTLGLEKVMTDLERNKRIVVDYYQTAFAGDPRRR